MPGALKPSSFVRTMFRGADVIYGLRVVRECRDAQFASLHRHDFDVTDVLRGLNKFDGHRVLTTSGPRRWSFPQDADRPRRASADGYFPQDFAAAAICPSSK